MSNVVAICVLMFSMHGNQVYISNNLPDAQCHEAAKELVAELKTNVAVITGPDARNYHYKHDWEKF